MASSKNTQKRKLNKQKGDITKAILGDLLLVGTLTVAVSAPYIVVPAVLLKKFTKYGHEPKALRDIFYYLRHSNLLKIITKEKSTTVQLTEKGKRRAFRYALKDMSIKKPKRWDRRWRILIFDVKANERIKRDALRHFIRRLGFYQLQKSVWIYPFGCRREVVFLRKALELNDREVRLLVSNDIGEDGELRKHFKV